MLLDNDIKQIILDALNRHIQTEVELWAFGSRVNGRAHSGSDLDLVVKCRDNQTLDVVALENFKADLKQSNIPFLIDVLDWGSIPESFKKNISQKYEVLKEL